MHAKDEKTAATVAAAVLTVFVLIVGPGFGWPVWLWLPAAVVPTAATAWLRHVVRTRRDQDRLRAEIAESAAPPPAPPPEPEQPRGEVLTDVSLRSATPDYRFLLSATVYWLPNPDNPGRAHGNLGALAREAIVSRAVSVLSGEPPEEHGALGARLDGVLGARLAVPSAQIDAWACDVSVTLPAADRERLHRLAEVRKEEQVWQRERDHERAVREYLADDVLSNPASAVVWWLARHHDDEDGLRTTVDNIPQLRRLTAAAHDTELPGPAESAPAESTHPWSVRVASAWQHVLSATGDDGVPAPFALDSTSPPDRAHAPVDHLLAFAESVAHDVPESERELFARRIAHVLDVHEQHEAAERLRGRIATSGEPPDGH